MQAARDIQQKRFSNLESSHVVDNAVIRVEEPRPFCKLQDEGQNLMRAAMTQLNLSARTIADLAGSEEIQSVQVAGKSNVIICLSPALFGEFARR